MLTFLTNLPSVLFLPSYICKLLSFHPSSSLILRQKSPVHIKSFYPSLQSKVHKTPVKGRKPHLVSYWYSSNPLFTPTLGGSALTCLDLPRVG